MRKRGCMLNKIFLITYTFSVQNTASNAKTGWATKSITFGDQLQKKWQQATIFANKNIKKPIELFLNKNGSILESTVTREKT